MLVDLEVNFCESLSKFITGNNIINRSIIKKHNEHLLKNGDFSLPNSLKFWSQQEFVKCSKRKTADKSTLLDYIGKDINDFIRESEHWCLQICKIALRLEYLHFYLDRRKAIGQFLLNGETNCKRVKEILQTPIHNVLLDNYCNQSTDLTSLRVMIVKEAVENLYKISKSNDAVVYITGKSTNKGPEGCYNVLCGSVLNTKTGNKETSLSADDYIKARHTEMTLIAQHKYGVRISSESKWKDFLEHLGNSAVTFELLQIKPSNCIKVNFECSSSGSSKGAAFVLYNCARLESILRAYNGKVIEGSYPSLPPMNEVDFSLLIDEDEWTLLFIYIFGFPSLISGSVIMNGKLCEFRPHNICNFLSSMVRVFSQYYRKIRILTEPRTHLQPVMFARLYLLKILNETLKTCLAIINIKSVSQM